MQLYSWSHFQMNSFSALNNQITLGWLQYMRNENVIYIYKWCSSIVVEKSMHEREVASSHLTIYKTYKFDSKY
jgi:hypothetical protein